MLFVFIVRGVSETDYFVGQLVSKEGEKQCQAKLPRFSLSLLKSLTGISKV